MKKLGDLIKEGFVTLKESDADKPNDECKEWVIRYLRDQSNLEGEDISFICSLIQVTDNILQVDRGSLDGLLGKIYKINKVGIDRVKAAKEQMSWQERFKWLLRGYKFRDIFEDDAELPRHYEYAIHEHKLQGDYADSIFEILNERENTTWTTRLSWAGRKYDAHKKCAEMSVGKNPVCATYRYALAANSAKAGFEILLEQKDAPLDEKVDRSKKWWEAHKLAADTAPVTEKKHAAYNRSFEGSAAATVFKLINPLREVSEEDKLLWAERWYSGSKEGADMLINMDNETAWCAYWSAKNAAEVLWERRKNLKLEKSIYCIWELLIGISDSYKRLLTTYRGAEFIANDIYRRTGKNSWKKKAEHLKQKRQRLVGQRENISIMFRGY